MLAVRWRGAVCRVGGGWKGIFAGIFNNNKNRPVHSKSKDWVPMERKKWRAEEDEVLRDLMAKKVSPQTMADAVGRSYKATAQRTFQLRRGIARVWKPVSRDGQAQGESEGELKGKKKEKGTGRAGRTWREVDKTMERSGTTTTSKSTSRPTSSRTTSSKPTTTSTSTPPTVVHHRRWTEEDHALLQSLQAKKMSLDSIAISMNRSYRSVAQRIHRLQYGTAAKPVESQALLTTAEREEIWSLKDAGWSWERIVLERFPDRKPGFIRQVYRVAQRRATGNHMRWDEESTRKLMQMRQDGTSWADIARELNRSLASVTYKYSVRTGKRDAEREYSLWSPQEDELLLKLRGKGATFAEIAKVFPWRTIGSVHSRYRVLIVEGNAKARARKARGEEKDRKEGRVRESKDG